MSLGRVARSEAEARFAEAEIELIVGGLDLMADGAHCFVAYWIEKSGVVAVHYYAGCPDGQSRKNVLAVGGVYVLIHQVNTN